MEWLYSKIKDTDMIRIVRVKKYKESLYRMMIVCDMHFQISTSENHDADTFDFISGKEFGLRYIKFKPISKMSEKLKHRFVEILFNKS